MIERRRHNLWRQEMKQQNNGSKQIRRLTAEKKWRIYQEFQQPSAKSEERLRKNSMYSCRPADNRESCAGRGAGAVAAEPARQTCILKQRKKQLAAARKNRIGCWRSQPLTDGGL